MQELTNELTEEGTNADFEVTEGSTESNDKITTPVYPTQNINKTQESSSKITPTVLDTTKNKTRVTRVVETTDMPKVSNIEKLSHPRFKKIIQILETPELPINTGDQVLATETPPTLEFNRIKKGIQIQDPKEYTTE